MDVGAGADDAAHLLVEEHRHLGPLHAALGDVVGVVERDRQVLARSRGAEQLDLGERDGARRSAGQLGEALGARLRRAHAPVRRAAPARRLRGRRPPRPRPGRAAARRRAGSGRAFIGRIVFSARRRSRRARRGAAGRAASRRSTIASPPFFIFTLAPVRRATSPERSGSWPTSRTRAPRPAASASASNGPPRSSSAASGSIPSAAQASRAVSAARTLGLARQASTGSPSSRQRSPGRLGLALALRGQAPGIVVLAALLGVPVSEQVDHAAAVSDPG